MNENLENNDWIEDAPTLAKMVKRNPFLVPNGYFDNCGQDAWNQLFLDGLKQNTSNNAFEVPVNYFEELTEIIETRIALEEINLPIKCFAVPENYFETLQNRINVKIAAEETKPKEAKVIPLWKRDFIKYASAACFVLMASFGVYFYQNNQSIATSANQLQSAEMTNDLMLYDIDESTIIEHVEAQNKSIKTNVSASDTEMENYILSNYSSTDLAQEL
ncbi:hypothetical protein QWY86_09020 [Pedobacter aquatilis]|uniref:hypothetical protein n=1 Tax=Pedobacter aquatilis TaxID=351343 RepID=UPI0025B3D1DB|nr:hypothetical protein [Pedobacter aquatilis]MDN3586806.1 hypothetical protein [Pedobacter aquatilis]